MVTIRLAGLIVGVRLAREDILRAVDLLIVTTAACRRWNHHNRMFQFVVQLVEKALEELLGILKEN